MTLHLIISINTELIMPIRWRVWQIKQYGSQKPKSFNDPFDCAITVDRALYKESIIHAITVAMDRANGSLCF